MFPVDWSIAWKPSRHQLDFNTYLVMAHWSGKLDHLSSSSGSTDQMARELDEEDYHVYDPTIFVSVSGRLPIC